MGTTLKIQCTGSSQGHLRLEPPGVLIILQQLKSEEMTQLMPLRYEPGNPLSIHSAPFFPTRLKVSTSQVCPSAGLDVELGHVLEGAGWRRREHEQGTSASPSGALGQQQTLESLLYLGNNRQNV